MDSNDRLRQLLAVKRLEQPPPGFFDRLPDQILARIRTARPPADAAWWRRLLDLLSARPAMASACGLLLGALMIASVGLPTADSDLTSVVLGQSMASPISAGETVHAWAQAPNVQLVRYTDSSFGPAVSVVPAAGTSFGSRPILAETVGYNSP